MSASTSDILKRVAVAYPSGNTTAVVFDELQDVGKKVLNSKILQSWERLQPDKPEIEQCCLVVSSRNPRAIARAEMFGGEFCANATSSVAWLLMNEQNGRGKIEASGVNHLLDFVIQDGLVSLEMPLPADRRFVRKVQEGVLVEFDGITQLVVIAEDARKRQSPRRLLHLMLKENRYGLAESPCVGVSYYDPKLASAKFCVWVKEVNTVFDETACGSGTCAIGIALAMALSSSVSLNITQPSGESISTTVNYREDRISGAQISSRVKRLYDGELAI